MEKQYTLAQLKALRTIYQRWQFARDPEPLPFEDGVFTVDTGQGLILVVEPDGHTHS